MAQQTLSGGNQIEEADQIAGDESLIPVEKFIERAVQEEWDEWDYYTEFPEFSGNFH